jgi:hypothetical protein
MQFPRISWVSTSSFLGWPIVEDVVMPSSHLLASIELTLRTNLFKGVYIPSICWLKPLLLQTIRWQLLPHSMSMVQIE